MILDWLQPRLWGLHAFAAVSIAACVAGGLWQFGVFESHRTDAQTRVARPVPLEKIWKPGEGLPGDAVGRRVVVQGGFAGGAESVESPEGRPWSVELLQVAGEHRALLVVRGYGTADTIADPPNRLRRLVVVLRPADQYVNVARLANELDVPLYAGYAIAETGTGLPLAKPPTSKVSWTVGLRNLLYAVQWWVFAGFAGFMWWRMARESVAAHR